MKPILKNQSSTKSSNAGVTNRCLICLAQCTSSSAAALGSKLNIPGAGRCAIMNKQLEQYFIVHKLLDVPREWCEQTLEENQRMANREGVKIDCVHVCVNCYRTKIRPAWEAYQKLMEFEAKIGRIKETIKVTMKKSILSGKKNNSWSGLTGGGTDAEIRKVVFPELLPGGSKKNISFSVRPRPSPTPDNNLSIALELESNESGNDDNDMDWEPLNDPDAKELPRQSTGVVAKKTKKKTTKKALPSSSNSTAARRLIKRIRKRKPRPRESLKRFKCSQCGCYFNSDEELNLHTEAHESSRQAGGGPHDCLKCTYPAQSLEELRAHQKKRHGRIRSHRCPNCAFKCRNWRVLKAHIENEHPGISEIQMSLKCPVCSRQFMRLETFTIHQRSSHPELFGPVSDEPLECRECGQRFMSRFKLEYHQNNEHVEKPFNYVCDLCGKKFEWKCRLDKHMVVHKLKRDFVCHLCGIDYAYQSLLNHHYKTVHPNETGEVGDVSTKLETTGETVEFKCRYCELTSPYKAVILRHLKTHKEETGHRCEKCGNCYMTEQGLRRHLKINHPETKENFPCPHCLKPFCSLEYMKVHVKLYCKLKHVEPAASFTSMTTNTADTQGTVFLGVGNVEYYNQQQQPNSDIAKVEF